jgi:hypothetical protein
MGGIVSVLFGVSACLLFLGTILCAIASARNEKCDLIAMFGDQCRRCRTQLSMLWSGREYFADPDGTRATRTSYRSTGLPHPGSTSG